MTIRTTAEHRTIDFCSARYINRGGAHISPSVKEHTLVTFTGTKYIANDRIIIYLLLGTRHTDSTTRYIDGTSTPRRKSCCRFAIVTQRIRSHIGMLISTVNAGENMSTCDIHLSSTSNRTCRTVPLARSKWNDTTTATKHVAVISMSVCGYRCSTLRRLCKFSIIIILFISWIQICRILVIRLTCGNLVIRPCSTCGKGVVCCHRSSRWVNESIISIWCTLSISNANLSTSYRYMRISLQIAILTTAIDGTFDEGMPANRHIRVGG